MNLCYVLFKIWCALSETTNLRPFNCLIADFSQMIFFVFFFYAIINGIHNFVSVGCPNMLLYWLILLESHHL